MILKCGLSAMKRSLLTPKSLSRITKVYSHTESCKIGMREVVGMGPNSEATYEDRSDFPCPAIRFYPDDPYLKALREKEKGDWRSLTIDEKKCLYRASFCQTYAEFNAPTGEWKSITGWTLFYCALSLWLFMFVRKFAHTEIPESFNLENRQAQLVRIIALRMNPIDGFASKYEYDTYKDKEEDEEKEDNEEEQ